MFVKINGDRSVAKVVLSELTLRRYDLSSKVYCTMSLCRKWGSIRGRKYKNYRKDLSSSKQDTTF